MLGEGMFFVVAFSCLLVSFLEKNVVWLSAVLLVTFYIISDNFPCCAFWKPKVFRLSKSLSVLPAVLPTDFNKCISQWRVQWKAGSHSSIKHSCMGDFSPQKIMDLHRREYCCFSLINLFRITWLCSLWSDAFIFSESEGILHPLKPRQDFICPHCFSW